MHFVAYNTTHVELLTARQFGKTIAPFATFESFRPLAVGSIVTLEGHRCVIEHRQVGARQTTLCVRALGVFRVDRPVP